MKWRAWLDRFVERNELWAFVCVAVFTLMGYLQGPLWLALLGGVLFGLPSLLRLVLMKGQHPRLGVPNPAVLDYAAQLDGDVYHLSQEERAAVRVGLEQAERGEFVPDTELQAFRNRHRA
jgi:predicted transcriptional regulator